MAAWVRLLFIALALSLALGACRTIDVDAKFDDESRRIAEEQLKPGGAAAIEGEAFMRRKNGIPVTAAGYRIFLFPATPYADAWFAQVFGKRHFNSAIVGVTPSNTEFDFTKYSRQTKANMRGRFSFDNLRPGRYWLITRVLWADSDYYPFPAGGVISEQVTVPDKGVVEVIISEN